VGDGLRGGALHEGLAAAAADDAEALPLGVHRRPPQGGAARGGRSACLTPGKPFKGAPMVVNLPWGSQVYFMCGT